ncbi:MobF family relaxase [Roseibacillus persicicus]|uniref:MobF family relaxase n=1 Tax=Roseibacillus persicicus TaxID=454148 RepID=UPI00398ACC24
MITVSQIRGGTGYMSRHLSANDYYSEKETVVGDWQGKSAWALGLEGQEVTAQAFDALAINRHPEHGGKLRPRDSKVSFHDFVISAPKSVSVAALVGGDERLREAYDQCVKQAFERLESFAARRERKGKFHGSEEYVRTGDTVAAVFKHDTSRLLDPQLHTHMVFANLTWDQTAGQWYALQPKLMAEESRIWIRGRFYRELESACQRLGYRTQRDQEGFRLLDMRKSTEVAMSQRTVQRKSFENRYEKTFGHRPSKKRIEYFIKERKGAALKRFRDEFEVAFGTKPSAQQVSEFVVDWRSDKMATSSKEQVAQVRHHRLTEEQRSEVHQLVKQAREGERESLQQTQGQTLNPNNDTFAITPPPTHKEKPLKAAKTKAAQRHPVQTPHRAEVIRRMKRGMVLARALQGHPATLVAAQIRQTARKRNENQRRV